MLHTSHLQACFSKLRAPSKFQIARVAAAEFPREPGSGDEPRSPNASVTRGPEFQQAQGKVLTRKNKVLVWPTPTFENTARSQLQRPQASVCQDSPTTTHNQGA